MRVSAARAEFSSSTDPSPSASKHSHTAVNLTASSFRRERDQAQTQLPENGGDAQSALHGPHPCGSGGSATDLPKTRCTPGSEVGQSGYQRGKVTGMQADG